MSRKNEDNGKKASPDKALSWKEKPLWMLIAGKPMVRVVLYALLFSGIYDAACLACASLPGALLLQAVLFGVYFIGLSFCAMELWGTRAGSLHGVKSLILFGWGTLLFLVAEGCLMELYRLFYLDANGVMVMIVQLLGAVVLILGVPMSLMLIRAVYECDAPAEIWPAFQTLMGQKLKKTLYGWLIILLFLVGVDSLLLGPMALQISATPVELMGSLLSLGNPLGYLSTLLMVYAQAGGAAFDLMMLALLLGILETWMWQIYARWSMLGSLKDITRARTLSTKEKREALKNRKNRRAD